MLASVGLPGLCGFVGEFLVLLGTFTANKTWAATGTVGFFPAPKLMGAISASAVILAAMYLLTMYQKLMFGPLDKPENRPCATSTAARPGCSASSSWRRWCWASARSRSSAARRSRWRPSSPATVTGCRRRGARPTAPRARLPGARPRRAAAVAPARRALAPGGTP